MSLKSDLLQIIDPILGIRDELGLTLKSVYLVTRTWSGSEPGDGTFVERKTKIAPSPGIVEFKMDLRLKEGGEVQAGDIMLKSISKHAYPNLSDLDCSTTDRKVEKFYELGGTDSRRGERYRFIQFIERQLTWRILIRRLSDQQG
jgi:hypothetical protein